MHIPEYLHKNDLVALIAPAGFIPDEQPVLAAEKWLASIGLRGIRGKYILGKKGVFSGSDKQRLEDFQNALDTPEIKAVWALRGGYGAMRIMGKLDFKKFKEHPKWLIGFSDITAFHNQLQLLGYPSIHGLMPVQMAKFPIETQAAAGTLRQALFGEKLHYEIPVSKYNRIGKAEGILTGGNLSLLQSLLGTPYQVDTNGKILFIEDVGEYPYRIDRMLQSLKLAGVFDQLAGLIVGDFTDIKENATPFGKNVKQMVLEVTRGKKYPILFNFPAGHIPDNKALVLGEKAKIMVEKEKSCLCFE